MWLELTHRLLAFDRDLLSFLGHLAFGRTTEVLRVQRRTLAGCSGLVLGLPAERVTLPASGGEQRLGLGLRLLDLSLHLTLQLLPQLIDLGRSAGLDRIALTSRVAAQPVRIPASRLLELLGFDGGLGHDLAGLVLGQPQDVVGAATQIEVGISAGAAALAVLQRRKLILKRS